MNKNRQSKDKLRKEKERIIKEMRELDLEIAKDNLSEDNGENLSWEYNENKNEKLDKLRTQLEEIQRILGNEDSA